MVRLRRAEQCLPKEGVTLERDAGALKCGCGNLTLSPSGDAQGAPFQGVATQPVPQKLFNPPRSELTKKVRFTGQKNPFGLWLNWKMSGQLPDLGLLDRIRLVLRTNFAFASDNISRMRIILERAIQIRIRPSA
jgi:hypothetical protein